MDKWKKYTFDEISLSSLIGLVRNSNEQSPSNEFNYLKMNNITNDGNLDLSVMVKVNATSEEVEKYKLLNGDFLFNTRNSIELVGKTAVFSSDDLMLFNNNILRVRFKKHIDSKFINYQFKSSLFKEKLEKIKSGTTNVAAIYYKSLRNVEVFAPLIEEQRRITSKLDELFLKIDKSILLLEENLKHSKALMGSILDEVFTNLENTSEVVKISKIADIKGGKRLPKGEQLQNTKTDYPYIRVTDFNDNGSIDVNDLKYMTKEIQSKISRYIITSDDLYISIAGTIGKTGIIPKELDGANLTENAARFVYKDKKGISNKFVYYYTKSDKFKAFVSEATKQVAQPKLALARLNEIELALPSITEQEKAVAKFIEMEKALSKMEKEIQIKLYNMKALKNSLLDQAFKGEL